MEVKELDIQGLLVLKPKVFKDERGYFFESYNLNLYREIGIMFDFVQDNQSLSDRDVLRGLHFQAPPFSQGKLVRVVRGAVLDVVVDIRKDSKTYGKYESIILSEQNFLQLWIPKGFAHGFLTLENNTLFEYKCTEFYNKQSERTILWNDKDLNIKWNVKNPIISDKDKKAELFENFISPF